MQIDKILNNYAVDLSALDLIEERFHVRLPEDEAGFIALHIECDL